MNGFAQHQAQYQQPIAEQDDQYHTTFKQDPYEINQQQRPAYAYAGQGSYSEQELAESLGWIDYSHNGHMHMNATQTMQVTNEMHMQHTPMHHRGHSASLQQTGSLASNGTFGSVSIPQASNSPSAWHSSTESPSFLTDSTHMGRSLSLAHQNSTNSAKKEISTVAEKKAMRRYSHNAVERRRRDNINEQIQELAILVQELGSSSSPRPDTAGLAANPSSTKPNKGVVLRKSVEYIRTLKAMVEEKNERERQMENEILRLGGILPDKTLSSLSMWVDESAIQEDE